MIPCRRAGAASAAPGRPAQHRAACRRGIPWTPPCLTGPTSRPLRTNTVGWGLRKAPLVGSSTGSLFLPRRTHAASSRSARWSLIVRTLGTPKGPPQKSARRGRCVQRCPPLGRAPSCRPGLPARERDVDGRAVGQRDDAWSTRARLRDLRPGTQPGSIVVQRLPAWNLNDAGVHLPCEAGALGCLAAAPEVGLLVAWQPSGGRVVLEDQPVGQVDDGQ